jgi:hypothetical protein
MMLPSSNFEEYDLLGTLQFNGVSIAHRLGKLLSSKVGCFGGPGVGTGGGAVNQEFVCGRSQL